MRSLMSLGSASGSCGSCGSWVWSDCTPSALEAAWVSSSGFLAGFFFLSEPPGGAKLPGPPGPPMPPRPMPLCARAPAEEASRVASTEREVSLRRASIRVKPILVLRAGRR